MTQKETSLIKQLIDSSSLANLEPRHEDGTPAYFTDIHNQYLERLLDIPRGQVAHIYTSPQFGLGLVITEGNAALERYLRSQASCKRQAKDSRTTSSMPPQSIDGASLKRGAAIRKNPNEGANTRSAISRRAAQQRVKTQSSPSSNSITVTRKSSSSHSSRKQNITGFQASPVIRPAKSAKKPKIHQVPQDAQYRTRSGRVVRAKSQRVVIEES